MKKVILSIMMLAFSSSAMYALVFEDGGFNYRTTGSNTVALTTGNGEEGYLGAYSGWSYPVVPETVTYGGITYTVTSIDDNAFAWSTNMGYVELPNTVEKIGFQSFNGCTGMTKAVLPGVKIIDSAAYSFCSDLKEVTLGSSLEGIGQTAFGWCSRLKTVVCEAVVPPVLYTSESVMYGDCFSSASSATLYVPRGSIMAYGASDIWGKFKAIVPIDNCMGPSDVNGDGEVNVTDAISLIELMLNYTDLPAYYDVNGDGEVNISDIILLIDGLLNNI